MAAPSSVRFTTKGSKRRGDAPSASVARLVWMLSTLLLDKVLDVAACERRFSRSRRDIQRDLRKLRLFGQTIGFQLDPIRRGRVFLHPTDARIATLNAVDADTSATLLQLAAGLGAPLDLPLRAAAGPAPAPRLSFLQVREAAPCDGDRVNATLGRLKDAATRLARIAFTYDARGSRRERRAEPYFVVVRSGRSYLVAYDLERRGWRHFALDKIGPVRLDGRFTPREVPPSLLAARAVGWFAGSQPIAVTVYLSPAVADAVTAQRWQAEQRVTRRDDGAEIVLAFADLGEAVRWSLRFGDDARILAPPEAVALARRTVDRIAAAYATGATQRQRERAG